MNILHLQTYDIGGAYMAASRLHRHLTAAGLNSRLMVHAQLCRGSDVISCHPQNIFHLLKNKVKFAAGPDGSTARSNPDYVFRDAEHAAVRDIGPLFRRVPFRPDIIVAHWISNFLSAEHLYHISDHYRAPVVWHLLDMAPLTGGCHYAWDCTGYTAQCGSCPALYSPAADDLSHSIWSRKREFIRSMNITLVPATARLAEQAGRASLFSGKKIEKILLGVDPDTFRPAARELPRTSFGLPLDRKIIFFGAQSLKSRRKGLSYLVEALNILLDRPDVKGEEIMLITAGHERDVRESLGRRLACRHLGFLGDDRSLAAAYQAADLFVCPSIEDSGPMMINEAIMCGTPVVSFDMGVARDLVHTGKTGYRAELKNSADLAHGMANILKLSRAEAADMSACCRQTGLDHCHPGIQAGAFHSLFGSLTKEG
ncbi:MAG: glycosyltransferase [Nitrospirae bacterium]|nr:glycosyltransferase [Nitrospirota bacterium]